MQTVVISVANGSCSKPMKVDIQSRSYVTTEGQSTSLLGVKPTSGARDKLLLSDSCRLVDMERPL
jgi:hypothetical protein